MPPCSPAGTLPDHPIVRGGTEPGALPASRIVSGHLVSSRTIETATAAGTFSPDPVH